MSLHMSHRRRLELPLGLFGVRVWRGCGLLWCCLCWSESLLLKRMKWR
jgi:hypothetical protein